jgi:PAS domain S-box-containing protein
MQDNQQTLLRSLEDLTAVVQGMQAGRLRTRLPEPATGPAELVALTRALNRLAETLQQREAERRQMVEDIDEQKRRDAVLAESEARFAAIFENAAIGISLIAPDGRVLAVNPALQELSGRSEAELIVLGGQSITYPEDRDVGRAEFAEVLAGKRNSYQVEKRYVHQDGRVHWMRQSISAVRDAAGKALYLVVIAEDIDERKRALEELRASEARFKAVFDNAAIGVAMMTLDRRIVQVNPTVARITGYSPEELFAINPSDMVVPEDRAIDRELFLELVDGQRDQYLTEKRYIRRDGSLFWGRINFALVRDAQGAPLYIVGMIEDINEEKAAQQTLAESEARFRTLYDSAEMGIVLVDLGSEGSQPLDEARFNQLVANQRLNPAMLRMFGYTAEEMQQTAIASLIYPEDHGIDAREFRQLLAGEIDSFRSEKRFVRKDGSVFWGRLTDSLARAADGTPQMVIGIIEDINEERLAKERLASQEAAHRRQLEHRIAERTRELNAANQRLAEKAAQDAVTAERTRLARDLHDAVTQTLFSTTLIADVLPELWVMNPAEGRRRLEELRQMTRGALAEMRTLLVELRPNALVEAPLATLLRQLTDAMVSRARIDIQLSAEGERKLPPDVQVGLYRIAQEALNNVVKHAKASHAVVTLRLGEAVRLTVADDGAGFDPGTVTADHLGLRIMRERAEAIGARLSVYSESGEGTQVSVLWDVTRNA